jgi:hypothetical protein
MERRWRDSSLHQGLIILINAKRRWILSILISAESSIRAVEDTK